MRWLRLNKFVPHEYSESFLLYDGIEVRFTDVGHLLGSSSINWITEDGISKKIVFSGDIGNLNQPLIKDPEYIKEADYVVMGSTYGDRDHGASPDYIGELTQIIQSTFDRGGNLGHSLLCCGQNRVLLYYIRKIRMNVWLRDVKFQGIC